MQCQLMAGLTFWGVRTAYLNLHGKRFVKHWWFCLKRGGIKKGCDAFEILRLIEIQQHYSDPMF